VIPSMADGAHSSMHGCADRRRHPAAVRRLAPQYLIVSPNTIATRKPEGPVGADRRRSPRRRRRPGWRSRSW
jgi:hypothetical protein